MESQCVREVGKALNEFSDALWQNSAVKDCAGLKQIAIQLKSDLPEHHSATRLLSSVPRDRGTSFTANDQDSTASAWSRAGGMVGSALNLIALTMLMRPALSKPLLSKFAEEGATECSLELGSRSLLLSNARKMTVLDGALSAGAAGIIDGGILTPSRDHNFIKSRLSQSLAEGLPMAVMGGAAPLYKELPLGKRIVASSSLNAVIGAGSTELSSLIVNHEKSSKTDVLRSALTYGVLGGSLTATDTFCTNLQARKIAQFEGTTIDEVHKTNRAVFDNGIQHRLTKVRRLTPDEPALAPIPDTVASGGAFNPTAIRGASSLQLSRRPVFAFVRAWPLKPDGENIESDRGSVIFRWAHPDKPHVLLEDKAGQRAPGFEMFEPLENNAVLGPRQPGEAAIEDPRVFRSNSWLPEPVEDLLRRSSFLKPVVQRALGHKYLMTSTRVENADDGLRVSLVGDVSNDLYHWEHMPNGQDGIIVKGRTPAAWNYVKSGVPVPLTPKDGLINAFARLTVKVPFKPIYMHIMNDYNVPFREVEEMFVHRDVYSLTRSDDGGQTWLPPTELIPKPDPRLRVTEPGTPFLSDLLGRSRTGSELTTLGNFAETDPQRPHLGDRVYSVYALRFSSDGTKYLGNYGPLWSPETRSELLPSTPDNKSLGTVVFAEGLINKGKKFYVYAGGADRNVVVGETMLVPTNDLRIANLVSATSMSSRALGKSISKHKRSGSHASSTEYATT